MPITVLTSVGSDMGPNVHNNTFGKVRFVEFMILFPAFRGSDFDLDDEVPLACLRTGGPYVMRVNPTRANNSSVSSAILDAGFSSKSVVEGMSSLGFSGCILPKVSV